MTQWVCGFSSDLDQNRAVLWSKSEMKHLKHPKHLKHFLWMLGLLFCKHFKELGGKVKDGVHRRQHQKGMLLLGGLGGMEENKKSRWVCFKLESRGVCTITNPEHRATR